MKRSNIAKEGRGPEDSQKAKHGGNRAGSHARGTDDQPGKSSQAAGKDPHRGSD